MLESSCREYHLNLPAKPRRVKSLEFFRKYITDTEGAQVKSVDKRWKKLLIFCDGR